MTIQPQSRATFPIRPFAIVGALTIGIAISVVAVYWYRDSGESTETTTGTALAPWVNSAPPTAAESLAIEMASHEAATDAQFGPIGGVRAAPSAESRALAEHDNAIAGALGPAVVVIPSTNSGRSYDEALADALAQHDNAFPPIKELPLAGIVVAPAVPAGQTFDEAMADAIARYGYPSPSSVGLANSGPAAQTFDEALADAIAQHGNAFPQIAPTENPYVADQ